MLDSSTSNTVPVELIGRLGNLIHDRLKDLVPNGSPIALLDFPDIRNCGDSAIWLGEINWLRTRFGKEPSYVCRDYDLDADALRATVPEGPIYIHGGGNFGDIWPGRQDFKDRVIASFPDRKIVQLPQSIHFNALERAEQTARLIEKHRDFTLMVRDLESKEFAERHFQCEVRLCPDMAFAIGPVLAKTATMPVLAMLREDREQSGLGEWTHPDIPREDWITENRHKVKFAKLMGAIGAGVTSAADRKFRFLHAAAQQRFQRGITQISRGKVIVTDRLHVHICATLIGRPHAVLDNSYGKIRRLMEAFYPEGTGLTHRPASLDEAVTWARAKAA
jgi:exopolysaccharide biosynthesis predicted pyruvyltransferase EpsI